MWKDEEFENQVRDVFLEIQEEDEQREEQFYHKFLQSNVQDSYDLNENFRNELLQRCRKQKNVNTYEGKLRRKMILVVIPLIVSLSAFIVAMAFGRDFLQFITTEIFTTLRIAQESDTSDDWETILTPSYLPDGYTLDLTEVTSRVITSIYKNDDKKLVIMQYNIEAVTFDTEDAEYEEIMICSNQSFYMEKGAFHFLYLYVNPYSIIIKGEVEKENLISIARGLK